VLVWTNVDFVSFDFVWVKRCDKIGLVELRRTTRATSGDRSRGLPSIAGCLPRGRRSERGMVHAAMAVVHAGMLLVYAGFYAVTRWKTQQFSTWSISKDRKKLQHYSATYSTSPWKLAFNGSMDAGYRWRGAAWSSGW